MSWMHGPYSEERSFFMKATTNESLLLEGRLV